MVCLKKGTNLIMLIFFKKEVICTKLYNQNNKHDTLHEH